MAGWSDGNVVLNLYHVFYAKKIDDTEIRVCLRGEHSVYLEYETEAERDHRFHELMHEMGYKDDLSDLFDDLG